MTWKMSLGILILILVIFTFNDSPDAPLEEINSPKNYTFIVAGHAYGTPREKNLGLYPKFVNQFDAIRTAKPEFIVFTGDLHRKASSESWALFKNQTEALGLKYYIAPGNHDLGTPVFLDQIQKPYLSFEHKNDFFLILNTNHLGWTLDEEQLNWLKNELENRKDKPGNIFVFTHQVWWINERGKVLELNKIEANSKEHLGKTGSFWKNTFPFFENLKNKVYFFSGDIGALSNKINFHKERKKNFFFIASGMGNKIHDNYVEVSVHEKGEVSLVSKKF